MWHDTAFTRRFGVRYPIVQGPFGGGLSSTRLAAIVSDAGGLGSFGLQGMPPEKIRAVIAELQSVTAAPFAVNLWVSTADTSASAITRADFEAATAVLARFYAALNVPTPTFPPAPDPSFENQAAAVLEARPPIFSFIFGVPPADVLDRCRTLGIRTIGTATTVDEARALDDAGVDAIVATGSEAGGHRPSFLRSPEASLTGTLSLVPQVVDAVRVPVIAAGGVADGRGLRSILALGGAAAQIGTAFLACDESNAHPLHRAVLRARPSSTMLTRGLTDRLGRAVRNDLAEAVSEPGMARLPYPFQGHLVSAIKQAALAGARPDLAPMWSGQSVGLVRHTLAAELFASLVDEAARLQS